jgi:hypothetical protein
VTRTKCSLFAEQLVPAAKANRGNPAGKAPIGGVAVIIRHNRDAQHSKLKRQQIITNAKTASQYLSLV